MAKEQRKEGQDSTGAGVSSVPASDHTPSQLAEAAEERGELVRMLNRLSIDQRQVVVLRTWDRLTFEQIGDRLGVSADTARKRFTRGMKALREHIRRKRIDDDDIDNG